MTHPFQRIGPLIHDPAFSLRFRLRQPVPAKPKGCMVLLHGVGGDEMNLADLAMHVEPEVLVVLARGPLELGPGQFGWFRVAFTATGPSIVAPEAEQSRLALIRFLDELRTAYGVTAERTLIAGFSQGGILSASVALSAPASVAGFAILSGRILPELEPVLGAPEGLRRLSGFIGHGEFDSKLPIAWAHRSDQWLTALGVPHLTRLYPMDHELGAAMATDFLAWSRDVMGSER